MSGPRKVVIGDDDDLLRQGIARLLTRSRGMLRPAEVSKQRTSVSGRLARSGRAARDAAKVPTGLLGTQIQ
jgi:hypothetical protein